MRRCGDEGGAVTLVIMPFRVYNDSSRSIGHVDLQALGMDKRASSHNSFCNDARSCCPDVLSCSCFLLMARSKQKWAVNNAVFNDYC